MSAGYPSADADPVLVDLRGQYGNVVRYTRLPGLVINVPPLSAKAVMTYFDTLAVGGVEPVAREALFRTLFRRTFFATPTDRARHVCAMPEADQLALVEQHVCAGGISACGDESRSPFGRFNAVCTIDQPHGITLANAIALVREAHGDTWYLNYRRWRTFDGYAPVAVVYADALAIRGYRHSIMRATQTAPLSLPPLSPMPFYAADRSRHHLN